eukprot:s635_g26.t2
MTLRLLPWQRARKWHGTLESLRHVKDGSKHLVEERRSRDGKLDSRSCTKSISSMGRRSLWQEICQLLEAMPGAFVKPNVFSYTAAISSCRKAANWQVALCFFGAMQVVALKPNVFSFNAAISCAADGARWPLALGLLEAMPAVEVRPNVISFNAAIAACDKGNEWQQALLLFDAIATAQLRPDEFSFNSTISALAAGGVKTTWERALELFSAMAVAEVQQDVISYNSTMSALQLCSQWQRSLDLFAQLTEETAADVVSYSVAISCSQRSRHWWEALRLYDLMALQSIQRDVVCANAVMNACQEAEEWQQVLKFLQRMGQAMLQPNLLSWISAITTCGRSSHWQRAVDLFATAESHDLQHSVVSFNSTISALEKGGQWQQATQLFQSMQRRGLRPTLVSFNAMISSFEKGERWQQGLLLFHALPATDQPDIISFNAAMSCCEKGQRWSEALQLFQLMSEVSVQADVISYSAAISSFEKASEWQLAFQCFRALCDADLQPNLICFNTTISACEKAGSWEEALDFLLAAMPRAKVLPDIVSFNASLSACEKLQQWSQVLDLFHMMPLVQIQPDIVSCCATMSSCEKASLWHKALGLFSAMRKAMVQPTTLSLKIAVAACERSAQWWLLHRLRHFNRPLDKRVAASESSSDSESGEEEEQTGKSRGSTRFSTITQGETRGDQTTRGSFVVSRSSTNQVESSTKMSRYQIRTGSMTSLDTALLMSSKSIIAYEWASEWAKSRGRRRGFFTSCKAPRDMEPRKRQRENSEMDEEDEEEHRWNQAMRWAQVLAYRFLQRQKRLYQRTGHRLCATRTPGVVIDAGRKGRRPREKLMKPGVSLYTVKTLLGFFLLVYALLNNQAILKEEERSFSQSLQENNFSVATLLLTVAHMTILLSDRELVNLVCLGGPTGEERMSLAHDWQLCVYYLAGMLYITVCMLQIKHGLPALGGDGLRPKSADMFSAANLYKEKVYYYVFMVYYNFPFLDDISVIVDWSVVPTSLDLWMYWTTGVDSDLMVGFHPLTGAIRSIFSSEDNYRKVEDAHTAFYRTRHLMFVRGQSYYAEQRDVLEKFYNGWAILCIVVLVILMPIIVFSPFSPFPNTVLVEQANVVLGMTVASSCDGYDPSQLCRYVEMELFRARAEALHASPAMLEEVQNILNKADQPDGGPAVAVAFDLRYRLQRSVLGLTSHTRSVCSCVPRSRCPGLGRSGGPRSWDSFAGAWPARIVELCTPGGVSSLGFSQEAGPKL